MRTINTLYRLFDEINQNPDISNHFYTRNGKTFLKAFIDHGAQDQSLVTMIDNLKHVATNCLINESGYSSNSYYHLLHKGEEIVIEKYGTVGPDRGSMKCPNGNWWIDYGRWI